MRMVASAKLHHTQGMTEAFLRYKDELQKIVDSLQLTVDNSMRTDDSSMQIDDPQGASQLSTVNCQLSTLLIPISSNSGLCGAFNSNIAKATMQRIQELEAQGRKVQLFPIGKKIAHELKKTNKEFSTDFVDMLDKIEKSNAYTDVETLVGCVNGLYQRETIDDVEFLYHHFKSMGTQVIQVDSLQLTTDNSMRTDDTQGASQLSAVNYQLSTYLT
jgi:F-type H+-transporting ATPase subunit gamma